MYRVDLVTRSEIVAISVTATIVQARVVSACYSSQARVVIYLFIKKCGHAACIVLIVSSLSHNKSAIQQVTINKLRFAHASLS